MRHALLAIAVAGLLAAAALPARAQGEFPLKYTNAQAGDPVIIMMARRSVWLVSEKPAGLKALPKEMTGEAKYFAIPLGGKQILAVVDAPKPPKPHGGPAGAANAVVIDPSKPVKLYVDAAGTGDLSAAQPLTLGGPGNTVEVGTYGPVAITVGGPQGPATIKLRFYITGNGRLLVMFPDGYMAGEVKLADQTYRVAAVSNSGDGRYDKAPQLPVSLMQSAFNILAIDLNQDGRFDGYPTLEAGEVMPLARMIKVKDVYYNVTLAPDGSSVRLEKADPGMGTIDVGSPDVEMMVFSDAGFQRFSGSGGKWKAPAGHYMGYLVQLSKTDAAGAKWTLPGWSSGKLESFEVRKGETLAMKLGPPLVTKVEATPAREGTVSIGMALEGQAGERYAPGAAKARGDLPPVKVHWYDVFKLGWTRTTPARDLPPVKVHWYDAVQSPPELKILDQAGKVLATGNFEWFA
jgi:hypothetical protein